MSPVTTFSIREAAQLIGVSDDTLRRNIDKGTLRASRRGGHLTIDGRDLVAFQQERQAAAEAEGTPTSARNRFTGLVMAVKKDKVMAEVQLQWGHRSRGGPTRVGPGYGVHGCTLHEIPHIFPAQK